MLENPNIEGWSATYREDPLIAEATRIAKQVAGGQEKLDEPGSDRGTLHAKLMEWRAVEKERSAEGREQMAIDADFKDGIQWAFKDAQVLAQRGQDPITFNRILPQVAWMAGTERRTRTDYKILPRTKDDVQGAKAQSDVLKYLSDVSKTRFHRSRAFEDAVACGVGWMEDYANPDPTGEPVLSRYESWRNVWYDSASVEFDLSDARYVWRERWLDLEVALALWPEQTELLLQSAERYDPDKEQGDAFYMGERLGAWEPDIPGRTLKYSSYSASSGSIRMGDRSRVCVIEFQYRAPTKVCLCGAPFKGQEFDPTNKRQLAAMLQGQLSLWRGVKLRTHLVMMTQKGIISSGRSPYRHDSFSFTPIWCYRRSRDNQPYGIVRNLRGIQEDINRRFARSLYRLSSNQIIADSTATDDWVEFKQQANDPNGVIRKRPGTAVEFRTDFQLSEADQRLMQQELLLFQETSGTTSENLGRETNAVSGRAVLARQQQGSMINEPIFDNLRLAVQLQGEKQLSLIRQYFDAPAVLRLTDSRGNPDWLEINTSGDNDITAAMADFVVSEQDYRASVRLAMYDTMMQMLGQMPPEIALQLLDLAVELGDLPNKDEMVSRIRKLNGQPDPDAQDDPEEVARAEAAAEAQAKQAQLAQAALELDLAERQAKVEKLKAEAQKIAGEMGGEAEDQTKHPLYVAMQQLQQQLAEAHGRIAQMLVEAKDRATEHNARLEAEKYRADRDRDSRVEAARLQADAVKDAAAKQTEAQRVTAEATAARDEGKAIEAKLTDALKAVEGKLADLKADMAERDKAHKEAMKAEREERKAREAEAREDRKREREESRAEKAEKDKEKKDAKPDKPGAPINLVVNVDAKPAAKKSIEITRDKDGNPTGAIIKPEGESK